MDVWYKCLSGVVYSVEFRYVCYYYNCKIKLTPFRMCIYKTKSQEYGSIIGEFLFILNFASSTEWLRQYIQLIVLCLFFFFFNFEFGVFISTHRHCFWNLITISGSPKRSAIQIHSICTSSQTNKETFLQVYWL